MSRRSTRRHALGAGLVATLVATLAVAGFAIGAPPAAAVAPTIRIDSPDNAAPLTVPTIHVAGQASMPSGGTVNGQLEIEVTSLDGHGGQKIAVNVSGNPVPFSWDYTTAYNGTYRVKITARGRDGTLDQTPSETRAEQRDVAVMVKPAAPTGLTTAVAKSRAVDLSWNPNTEPDIVGYQVQRAVDQGDEWTALANTTANTFSDGTTTTAAGTYRYRIVAVRHGVAADEGVSSDPSPEKSANVPKPPATTTTTANNGGATGSNNGAGTGSGSQAGTGTGTGSGSTGSASTGSDPNSPELARTGKVDLSGFSALLDKAKRPANTTRPEEPDPGFGETLPFNGKDEPAVGEDGTALGVGIREASPSDEAGRQPIAFVAASLLVTVILMHLLWLKREVDKVPLDLPAES